MSTKLIGAVILTRASGEEILVTDKEQETVRLNNTVIITCDGPRCAKRHKKTEPVTLVINDEAVRKEAGAMPDGFYRFMKLQPGALEKELVEFCSRRCALDWLNDSYVEPSSPREKAAETSRFDQGQGPVTQADGEA